MYQEAVGAIKDLYAAGALSFITCESSPDNPPKVVAHFKTIEEAQAFYRALIECGEAAKMDEERAAALDELAKQAQELDMGY